MNEIQKIYDIAVNEVGYLEKKSRSYLYSKTKNAGYHNVTKYWRDLTQIGLMTYYGYNTSSDFSGDDTWTYDAAGITWAFEKALGKERAMELLLHDQIGNAAFIDGCVLASLSKKLNLLYKNPKIGDIALFYNNDVLYDTYHVEWVYKANGNVFYTIGWNTSDSEGVITNGGSVCCKAYNTQFINVKFYRPNYDPESYEKKVSENFARQYSVTFLKFGSYGPMVKEMQRKLLYLGYKMGRFGNDGAFGEYTKGAVCEFQRKYGLEDDGIVEENTMFKINAIYTKAVETATDIQDALLRGALTQQPPLIHIDVHPEKSDVLFIGNCIKDYTPVKVWADDSYGHNYDYPYMMKKEICEVLDYTKRDHLFRTWYYCRIMDDGYPYYGFINAEYIRAIKQET